MKKIILFFVFGGLSLYGFSFNPIDPPVKTSGAVNTITAQSSATTDECSDLYSEVPVTVVLTIADCPDYDCALPNPGCTIQICFYKGQNCSGQSLGCVSFDPDTCTYSIDVRADEGDYVSAKLVCSGCNYSYGNGCQSSGLIPQGGGTVYINALKFCP